MLNNLVIIGTYLPSADSRSSTEISYKKELNKIEMEYNKYKKSGYEIMIIGDFNTDTKRKQKRCENFNKFIEINNLIIKENDFEQSVNHSYFFKYLDKKTNNVVDIKSTIDYTLGNKDNKNFISVRRFMDKCNLSDHHATRIEYKLIPNKDKIHVYSSNKRKNYLNWCDGEFVENFRIRVKIGCANLISRIKSKRNVEDADIIKKHINKINLDFQYNIMEASYKAKNELYLSGKTKKRKFRTKTKKWWNDELKISFNKIMRLREEHTTVLNTTPIDLIKENKLKLEINDCKRQFRFLKRYNLKLLRDCNLRKIDEMFKMNKNGFWAKLKKLSAEKQDIIVELSTIKNEFAKIFTTRNKPNNEHEIKIKKIVDKFVEETFDTIHNFKINDKMINDYIDDLPNDKAIGISGISNEMLRIGKCTEMIIVICHIFETVINFGILPFNFNLSILKPLVKDKNKSTSDPSNLIPLAISDAISNMLERILLYFVDLTYINHSKQFGFKKNSSCSHAIFCLRTAIDYAKIKNKRLYTVAIDASKAFDKVNRLYLWEKLINNGIHEAVIRSIISYYDQSEILVSVNNAFSDKFQSTNGVRQGGVLSPRLFAIYIHDLISEISKMKIGIRIGNISIDIIGYADDILIVSNLLINIQKMLHIIERYSDEHEIKINADKTVLLIFNKWCQRSKKELESDNAQFKPILQNIELNETFEMKYLGVEFTSDYTNKKHIETRCSKSNKAAAMIKSRGLTDKAIHPFTKIQLFKSFILPICTYGVDLLELSKKDFNKIRITESNNAKSFINIWSSCRTKPVYNAFKIESLERRLNKMKLSLFNRLNQNKHTKILIDELNKNNVVTPFLKSIKELTNEFSNAMNMTQKCSIKIDILTKATEEDQKNGKMVNELRKIANLKDRATIPVILMSKLNTYTTINKIM